MKVVLTCVPKWYFPDDGQKMQILTYLQLSKNVPSLILFLKIDKCLYFRFLKKNGVTLSTCIYTLLLKHLRSIEKKKKVLTLFLPQISWTRIFRLLGKHMCSQETLQCPKEMKVCSWGTKILTIYKGYNCLWLSKGSQHKQIAKHICWIKLIRKKSKRAS